MKRAVFLDRDGVINELIYYPDHGIVDSPFTTEQFRLLTGVAQAINRIHELGFKAIVVSNQPGIAKGFFTKGDFEKVREKMRDDLSQDGAFVDGEYYCHHHPSARVKNLKQDCECRKPKPGLLLSAAREMEIDLSQSWMIGDGLTDIQAGKRAGCRTVLTGRMKCELCPYMNEEDAHPDIIAANLSEAVIKIKENLQVSESNQ